MENSRICVKTNTGLYNFRRLPIEANLAGQASNKVHIIFKQFKNFLYNKRYLSKLTEIKSKLKFKDYE